MAQTLAFPVHPAWKTGKPGAMPAHQRLPWKPVELPQNPSLGDGEGKIKAIALGALLLPTTAAAAVAFLGFRAGSRDEESWVSVLGYVIGALASVSALLGVLAMLGVAVTPFDFSPKTSEVAALPSAPATPAKI